MVFKLHPQSEERKRSAVTLIKYLLAEKKPEVLPAHYRELLSTLLWKVTEADSRKYKTRFQTQGALGCSDKANLRHEHVFQRSKMIAALEKAAPHEVDDIPEGCDWVHGYRRRTYSPIQIRRRIRLGALSKSRDYHN